jgi:hypothetical protein
MQSHDRIITLRGQRVRIYGSAWWLDAATESYDGKYIDVARIHAESLDQRAPSKEQLAADPGLNPYSLNTSNKGRLATYMLGLSDAELQEHGIEPGCLVFPDVVPGSRPASNITSRPISQRQQRQSLDWLQNDCIGSPADH